MCEYTNYFNKWQMRWVVPYLMKVYFGNKPTSNKKLSEAFWKLMGKNVEIGGKQRWTDGETGVPYQIHRLTNELILAEVPAGDHSISNEFPEYIYYYVLGDYGQKEIDIFLGQFPKDLIDNEILKFLGFERIRK